jgi:hypothetical protein
MQDDASNVLKSEKGERTLFISGRAGRIMLLKLIKAGKNGR